MNSTKAVIALIVTVKIGIFGIIFLAFHLLPFAERYYFANFHYPFDEAISLETAYKTWDAQHYLYLAEDGYKRGNFSNSFYPLFPSLIKIIAPLFAGNLFLAGLFISNVISITAFLFFFFYVKNLYNRNIAFTALIFMLTFPTSFYFSLIYSESLFLFLTIVFFYFLQKQKYLHAGLFSFFIPITRPLGLAIVGPFFIQYIQYCVFPVWHVYKNRLRAFINKNIVFLLFPFIGFAFYLLLMYIKTSSAFEGFFVQQFSVGQWSIVNVFKPQIFLQNFFTNELTLHGFTTSLLDRIFFVFFLVMLPFIYKKTNATLFFYSLLLGVIPPLLGSFMSYTRYIVVIFPLFITLGILFENKKLEMFKMPIFYLSIVLQTLFVILHALNYWVA